MAYEGLGKQIALLRRSQKLTQEQLASKVGVSAGAVSKWETASSMPDIALLAPLARALATTVDGLLSFQVEPSQEELAAIKARLTSLFLQNGYPEGKNRCKKYLLEYPNCHSLKLMAAGLYAMYSATAAEAGEEFLQAEQEAALRLYQEVIDSGSANLRTPAMYGAAMIFMELKRYDESEQILKELNQTSIDLLPLYASLLLRQKKWEETESLCKRMLLQSVNQSAAALAVLASVEEERSNDTKAEEYLHAAHEFQLRFGVGLGATSYRLCLLKLKKEENQAAAEYFLCAAKEILSTGCDYEKNPFFHGLRLEVKAEGQRILRKKMIASLLEDNHLFKLAGYPAYEKAVALLKEELSSDSRVQQ